MASICYLVVGLLVPLDALGLVPGDGTNVEEVFTVFAQSMSRRLMGVLQM